MSNPYVSLTFSFETGFDIFYFRGFTFHVGKRKRPIRGGPNRQSVPPAANTIAPTSNVASSSNVAPSSNVASSSNERPAKKARPEDKPQRKPNPRSHHLKLLDVPDDAKTTKVRLTFVSDALHF